MYAQRTLKATGDFHLGRRFDHDQARPFKRASEKAYRATG